MRRHAGRNALDARVPLFAPEYDGMPEQATGNRELLQVGARALLRSQRTGRANLEAVLATIKEGTAAPLVGQVQLSWMT